MQNLRKLRGNRKLRERRDTKDILEGFLKGKEIEENDMLINKKEIKVNEQKEKNVAKIMANTYNFLTSNVRKH